MNVNKINLKKFSIIVSIAVAILAGIADFINIYDWIEIPDVPQHTNLLTNKNKDEKNIRNIRIRNGCAISQRRPVGNDWRSVRHILQGRSHRQLEQQRDIYRIEQ